MVSLFIGRFQPVHKGHIHTIKQILERDEELIIVIGSAQHSHTPDNPFTGGERLMFLRNALMEEDMSMKDISVVPVPDVGINPIWISHMNSLIPYYDRVVTHNPLVKTLFRDHGIEVFETELLERNTFSAKHVRELMRWDGEWEPLVPDSVVKMIKKYKMDLRVKNVGEARIKR
jgi:nicotinamide-nucleotide adenylyltransferase